MPRFKKGDLVEVDPKAKRPVQTWKMSPTEVHKELASTLGPPPWRVFSVEPVSHAQFYVIQFEKATLRFCEARFKLWKSSPNERNQRLLRGRKDG